jgi:hypothetical protein
MRPARLAALLVLAVTVPAPALANPATGTFSGDGPTVRVDLRNDGGPDEFLRLEPPPGVAATAVAVVGGGATCSLAGPSVRCAFPGPAFWPAGGTAILDVTTTPPMGVGSAFSLFVCPSPCAGRDAGPFVVPRATAPGAFDLAVTLTGPTRVGPDDEPRYVATITNVGTARSGAARLTVTTGSGSLFRTAAPDSGALLYDSFDSALDPIEPGASATRRFGITPTTELFGVLRFAPVATVRAAGDANRTNDEATFETRVGRSTPADTRISRSGPDRVEGTASRATRHVEVAIVRATSGARAAAASCRVLAGRSGRLRAARVRAGRCTEVTWVRASGTRRWRLRLARRLPSGTYVVYTRAVKADGTPERTFGARDGNRRVLRVGRVSPATG